MIHKKVGHNGVKLLPKKAAMHISLFFFVFFFLKKRMVCCKEKIYVCPADLCSLSTSKERQYKRQLQKTMCCSWVGRITAFEKMPENWLDYSSCKNM